MARTVARGWQARRRCLLRCALVQRAPHQSTYLLRYSSTQWCRVVALVYSDQTVPTFYVVHVVQSSSSSRPYESVSLSTRWRRMTQRRDPFFDHAVEHRAVWLAHGDGILPVQPLMAAWVVLGRKLVIGRQRAGASCPPPAAAVASRRHEEPQWKSASGLALLWRARNASSSSARRLPSVVPPAS